MAKSLGAKGTRNYQSRSGSNTSVRGNQMSRHQTPARSAATATVKNGQRVTGAPSGRSQQALTVRTGTIQRKYSTKTGQFRAPKGMPSKLNNTAAAAISAKRYRSTAIGSAYLHGAAAPASIVLGFTSHGRNKRNNFSTVRLKAAGYQVAGAGYGGVIKPASAKTQARAQAKLQRKTGSRVSTGKATVGTRAKGTPPKGGGGRRNFRPRRDSRGRWAGSY